jgi:hypothetical protein
MMKKVICKCGSDKWRLKSSLVYSCIPPINEEIYECINCGETHTKTSQQTMEEYNPVVELFEENVE